MTSEKDIIKGLKQLSKVDSASLERNRAKLLAYYKEQFPSQKKDLFFYFKPAFVTMAALFFFLVSSGGLVVYAQKALPGSTFYTLKRVYEKVVFALTPADQIPVLRAELAVKRFNEVKGLVDKDGEKFYALSIQEATHNLEKEIAALKNEIAWGDQTISLFDSPIRDNKKIIEVFKDKKIDINKILADTKEALQDKDLEMAMEKINEVEKIFSDIGIEEVVVTENQLKEEQVVGELEESQKNEIENVLKEEMTEVENKNQETEKPVLLKPVQPIKEINFKIDTEVEKIAPENTQTDLSK